MRTAGLFALGAFIGLGCSETPADIICTTPQSRVFAASHHVRGILHQADYREICNNKPDATTSLSSIVTRHSGLLVLTITRLYGTGALNVAQCSSYFETIIQRCGSGGTITPNGVKYEVKEDETKFQSIDRRSQEKPTKPKITPPKSTKSNASKPKAEKNNPKGVKPEKDRKPLTDCDTAKKQGGKKPKGTKIGDKKTARDVIADLVPWFTRRASSPPSDFSDETAACLIKAENLADFKKGASGWGGTWFGFIDEPSNARWTDATVQGFAKAAYEKLKAAEPSLVTIVAALWEEGVGVHLGSIPHDAGKTKFKADAPATAPVLWGLIQGRTVTGSVSLYHAEDAAMFHYERTAKMTPYSGRMYMTAYGRGKGAETAQSQAPCGSPSRPASIKPSCYSVLEDLQIRNDG